MANQQGNGRNVAVPDENRQSWRPQDDNATRGRRGMSDDDDRYMSRDRDEDRYMQRDRDRFGSHWDERSSRDEGYRSTERYGQGQSGYGAGRYEDDRGFQSRNMGYPGGMDERARERGLDERFSQGRGGSSWGDQSYEGRGGYLGQGDQQIGNPYGSRGQSGYGSQGRGQQQWGNEGYSSGGDQDRYGSSGHWRQQGQQGDWQGRDWQGGQGRSDRDLGMRHPYGSQQGAFGGQGSTIGQQSSMQGGRGAQGQGGLYGQGGYNEGMYGQGGMQNRFGSQGYQGFGQEPQQSHRGKGPAGYMRSDERIREMVCEALADDHHVDATNIEITVKSGEVVLSGTVDDRQQKRMAEDIVERVSGVKDVQNQIRVSVDKKASGKEASSKDMSKDTSSKEPDPTTTSDKRHRA
jgi:osmotically-inducible protein OsmY